MSLVMSLAAQASVNMYPKTTSCYNKVGQTTWFKIFSEKQTGEGLHISPHQLGCCTVIHRYSVYSVSSYDRSLSTKNWFLRPVAPLQHPTRVLRDSTAIGKKNKYHAVQVTQGKWRLLTPGCALKADLSQDGGLT